MLDYIMTDQEIQSCMEELYQKQQKCLKLQKRLVFVSVVLFMVGFIPLLAVSLVGILWGGRLANKATSLARKRYPYVPIGPGYGGRGFSFDLTLMAEATHFNDDITLEILRFNRSSVNYSVAAIVGCSLMWLLVALLKEITGIDLYALFI